MDYTHHFMPVVFISSPYAGDVERNVRKARQYCRFALDAGYIPIAPHLLFPQFMDEQTERRKAMFMNLVLLSKCVEFWYFGDEITSGMDIELTRAQKRKLTIRHFTEECQEVPRFENLSR
jgi:hypothetical protein